MNNYTARPIPNSDSFSGQFQFDSYNAITMKIVKEWENPMDLAEKNCNTLALTPHNLANGISNLAKTFSFINTKCARFTDVAQEVRESRGARNSNCGGFCCHENSMQLLRVNLKTQITRLRQDVKLKCKAQWINYSASSIIYITNRRNRSQLFPVPITCVID